MNTIVETVSGIANQLRIHSINATTAAGSGHPSSCCSAADLVAALFFGHMRYDPKNPHYANNDRFILSKAHAAPAICGRGDRVTRTRVECRDGHGAVRAAG